MDDTFSIDENFFAALALLHSNDEDSAEKLRKMLDASIEKKYGFEKTLTARMPKRFLQNNKTREKNCTLKNGAKKYEIVREMENELKRSQIDDLLVYTSNATENNSELTKVFDAEYEDYTEKGDIPRISIPDEGSGDGLLCKICNGAKLGPLILLDCQECQDSYHPLCHQPPVVDIDVYDPRIVWRCRKCIETSTVSSTNVPSEEKKLKAVRRLNEPIKTKDNSKIEKSRLMNVSLHDLETNLTEITDSIDSTKKKESNLQDPPRAKENTNVVQKSSKNLVSAHNQLRKRVGSKLSVSRIATK